MFIELIFCSSLYMGYRSCQKSKIRKMITGFSRVDSDSGLVQADSSSVKGKNIASKPSRPARQDKGKLIIYLLEHKAYWTDKLILLFGKSIRYRQMQEITAGTYEISKAEKKMNRLFSIATIGLGVAGLSFFYSSFFWLLLVIQIYLAIPFYQKALTTVFKKHRISSYTLDAFLISGILFGGYLRVGAIGAWAAILGMKLLQQSENNTKQNLTNLFGEQPRSVWVLVEGVEIEIPFEKLQPGNVIVVSAGQTIPVDGIITSGFASIDQHKLTGESQPAEKGSGATVLAATVVLAGRIHIKTEKTGQETVAMQIGKMLTQTSHFKNSIQSRGEVIADNFVLPTIGVSSLGFLFLGYSSGLAVLNNMFGYKMRIFAPASMLSFLNVSSQQGILIKDGRSLELLNKVDTIIFDKTGTLTMDQPFVSNVYSDLGFCEDEILSYAASAEYKQSHPIAKAIVTAANQRQLEWFKIEDAHYKIGYGIQVHLSDRIVRVGSHNFMSQEGIVIPVEMQKREQNSHQQGHSLVMVAFDELLVGAIELEATIRSEVKQVIDDLRQRNMSIYIISGDHEQPTKKLAQSLGIENYFANTLPENKAQLVEQLQEEGHAVCFIGDGINDSIALKKANVSVSLCGATTAATDTAQVVFMDGSLKQLGELFRIAKEFESNMKNNFLISTIPSILCLGGIVVFHWGVVMGILISQTVLFMGLGNAMLPQLKLFTDKPKSK
ncbi:TPA: heavy metal translocating P-type ATPase [Candidatus Poribacteria bacterium]|nr:heavy metal translocating P-type ATPase [Candidatus Poribacteria bacterium]